MLGFDNTISLKIYVFDKSGLLDNNEQLMISSEHLNTFTMSSYLNRVVLYWPQPCNTGLMSFKLYESVMEYPVALYLVTNKR